MRPLWQRRASRRDLVFLVVWILLAIASFALAAHYTTKIVAISRKPTPVSVIGVYGTTTMRGEYVPEADYVSNDAGQYLWITLPSSATKVLLSGTRGAKCVAEVSGTNQDWKSVPNARPQVTLNTNGYHGSVDAFDVRGADVLKCSLHLGSAERFTTDALRLYYPSSYHALNDANLFDAPKLRFVNDASSAEHIQVVGAAALGGAVQLEPGDDAIVRWDVTTQESLRDLYLVIIGTLIAFGAALTIEVFRKLIEIALPD